MPAFVAKPLRQVAQPDAPRGRLAKAERLAGSPRIGDEPALVAGAHPRHA
jgi:hypothetical protein